MKKRVIKFFLFLLILLAPLLVVPVPARASTWLRMDTEFFTILYTEESHSQTQLLSRLIDPIYLTLAETTGYSPSAPVLVRLYPNEHIYLEVNLLARDNGLALQDPVGSEIAIVMSRVSTSQPDHLIDLLRAGIAQFLVTDITKDKLPWPLAVGFGEYYAGPDAVGIQDKLQILNDAQAEGNLLSWAELFQPDVVFEDAQLTHAECYGLVSFLIGRYGLPNFISLLPAFVSEPGYRSAIESVYGTPASELESHWEHSLTAFVQEQWQFNVFYNYDLGYAEELLELGAYSAAETELNQAIAIMMASGQDQGVTQANELLETAYQGQEAGRLVEDARQALENNEYEETQRLVDQARAAFAALDDNSRADELASYEARVGEVLAARAELDRVTGLITTGQLEEARITLDEATARLSALGDSEGLAQARQVYRNMNSLTSWISSGLLILGAFILFLNLIIRWRHHKQAVHKTESGLI